MLRLIGVFLIRCVGGGVWGFLVWCLSVVGIGL